MRQSPRKPYLRDTYSPSTKKLLLEKSLGSKEGDSDQEETINRYSPSRNSQRKQSPEANRLRSTYSPATFSSKYLVDKPKNEITPQNWKSAARLTGLSPGSVRRSSQVVTSDKGLSKIESQLDLLEQRVSRAIKELTSKNSKKVIGASNELKSISEDTETEYAVQSGQLERTKKVSRQKSLSRRFSKSKRSSDLKATLKIPQLQKLITTEPKPKDAVGFALNPYSPRQHNIYYVSELRRAIDQQKSLAKDHIRSAIKILKNLQQVQLPIYASRMLNLKRSPQYSGKKTLVFDLDETLIHCNQNPEDKSDVKLNIVLQTGDFFEAGINIRPYALTLLQNLYKKFELILFTASHSSYANVVLDYLDPDKKLFQHRLYREHCYHTEVGMYVKDLRIINRKPEEIVLIDNAAYSYAFQLDNGIPILNYYQGQDYELKALQKYIEKLQDAPDVRTINRQTFKLHHYTKFDNPQELIEQLYIN